MEEEDKICTPVIPKNRLRLGLGRNTSGSKKGSQSTPGFRINVRKDLWTPPENRTDEIPPPVTLSPSKLTNNAQTPVSSKNNYMLRRIGATTTWRPYNLSLNRKIREQTKKRLEFYLANEACENEENNLPNESEKADKASSGHEVQQNAGNHDSKEESVATADALLPSVLETADDVHTKKLNDLKASIDVWKAGFVAALTELQSNIDPHLEFPVILSQLKIAPEMIKYLDEN